MKDPLFWRFCAGVLIIDAGWLLWTWRQTRRRRRWQARFDERILGSWRREQGLDNHDR